VTRTIAAIEELGPLTTKFKVTGDLTIKDVSKEIAFEALLSKNMDGQLKAQAHFDFDRTQWHVFYGSGKFFEKLGSHLVSDIISLELFLSFEK
jgi:polyisoprenoid-binding protein YceI